MKKAIFVSKIKNLKGYKLTLAVQMFPITPAKYNVIKDIKVSEEEYQKLTNNFYEGWAWLPETAHENGVLNCVRINEKLLVANEGYDYARYIALEGEGA